MRKLFDNGYGPLILLTAVLFGFSVGVFFIKFNPQYGLISKNQKKMQDLIYVIENDYVDEVNTDSIVDKTIDAILSELDPHSKYIAPELTQMAEDDLNGEFVGIGISYLRMNDTIVIQRVLENSPNQGKIFTGDKLLSADQHPLTGDSIHFASKYLKGIENTKVKVSLIRGQDTITQNLERKKIINSPIRAAYMINDSIGFINLNTFTYNSGDLISNAIDDLKIQGMKTLVLDLRGNGGGFLREAKKIADEFLADQKVMYYVKGRKNKKEETVATKEGDFEQGKLYILIDEESASASELLAGAIQDQDRGIIVGRRSFGKGLVQQEMELSDGSKVRLTTARYYTPTGRSIQKAFSKGEKGVKAYQNESFERYHSGEMYFVDSIKINDSLKFKTPKGKVVYGGGGIIPDVFVAVDTLSVGDWYYLQQGRANIYDYTNRYILENKEQLAQWNIETFNTKFDQEKVYKEYLKKFKKVGKVSKADQEKIQQLLKALIARNFYGDEAYFKIYNHSDNTIKKVLELEKTLN
ncbi:C-terminal processing peptidase [Flavobacteriaceae bacterium UJ101]|nr:C-terminal processing peptidase [Flavobacteriaceae bacterium UJ101]